ncbi:hypothetical protein TEHMS4_07740 [Tetragenococcus halophilus]|nr:hypothetical protein TEHMS4_07740 [Tetragenococcus halophilus]
MFRNNDWRIGVIVKNIAQKVKIVLFYLILIFSNEYIPYIRLLKNEILLKLLYNSSTISGD